MNLPYITAQIGRATDDGDPFAPLYSHKRDYKEGQQAYNVFLKLDLDRKVIYFDGIFPDSQKSSEEYNYFGNNSAAEKQYFAARSVKDSYRLIGSVINDLKMELEVQSMQESDLYGLIATLENQGMAENSGKKGKGKLNAQKIVERKSQEPIGIALEEKKIIKNGEEISPENLIRGILEMEGKNDRIHLVIPVFINEGKEIVVSKHPDYEEMVKKSKKLEDASEDESGGSSKRMCYICSMEKGDVKCSDYFSKLSRTGINKIFTTTTLNYSGNFKKDSYVDSYSICSKCYMDLSRGEEFVENRLRVRIAGESAFIIPEGIVEDFDYSMIEDVRKNADICFDPRRAEEFARVIEAEYDWNEDAYNYNMNFIIYRTDGNSVNVMEVIQDIPSSRFRKVNSAIVSNSSRYEDYIEPMNLGSVYWSMPVSKNKKKEQLDIKKVLSFYDAILSGHRIDAAAVFSYAVKKMEEIRKDYQDKGEFMIKDVVFRYLALMASLQELGILDRKEFVRGDLKLTEIIAKSDSLERIEGFLESEGFDREASAMFCLGVLIKSVASAQYNKSHSKKPILQKIRFQGMNKDDVLSLYSDVVEKLRQYEKMNYFNESVMKIFHEKLGNPDSKWRHRDADNVFYIMAGYSFMTGKAKKEGEEDEEYDG